VPELGIECLTVFGLPPVEYVTLAADVGCRHISTGLIPFSYNPHGYPAWSLRDDAKLRREMIAAMRDRGVSISLGEGFAIRAGMDVAERANDLAIFCELGVKRINTVAFDPDLQRNIDQIGKLAEMAKIHGVELTLEAPPTSVIGNFNAARAAVREINSMNLRLMIDTMHFVRSGSLISELANADKSLISYVQLSDVPLTSANPNYQDEAMFERLPPGEGELPLLEILNVLPRDLVYSLEIPNRAQAEAGVSAHEWSNRCAAGARRLFAQMTN
jgi:sugar phosphate isomerase/epimerase